MSARRDRQRGALHRTARSPAALIVLAFAAVVVGVAALAWLRAASTSAGGVGPGAQELARSDPPAQAFTQGFDGPAPTFTVNTLEHGRFDLFKQRGRPVVLFFSSPT